MAYDKEQHKQHQKLWMEKQKAKGLCIFCRQAHLVNNQLCENHYLMGKALALVGDRDAWFELKEKLELQDYRCYYTGRKLVLGLNANIDHKLPRARFPEKVSDLNNVVWCDSRVNWLKFQLTEDELIELCNEILNWQKTKVEQH